MKKLLIAILLFIPTLVQAEFIGVMGTVNPETTVDLVDEFMGGNTTSGNVGNLGWEYTVGTVSENAGALAVPGSIKWETGGTINTKGGLSLGGLGTIKPIDADANFDITFNLKVSQTTNQEVRIGVSADETLAPAVHGIYFIHDTQATSSETGASNPSTTNWVCATRNSSTSTLTDSTVAVGTTFKLFRIMRSGTSILFFIDGTLRCTHTTNITDQVVMPMVSAENLEALTKVFIVDFFRYRQYGISR